MKRFKIADHVVGIKGGLSDEILDLLPGFKPFVYDGTQESVLTVEIDTSMQFETMGEEIGQFDVGGCNHGVYLKGDGGYQFEVSDASDHLCAIMESTAGFTNCRVNVFDGTWSQRNFGLNNCMMMSYAFATAQLDTLLVHASVIRCDGKGYMMTAPSGTGKSTHTHLWYTSIPGCDLMNDDNPIARIVDGQPIVYGSPWSGKTPCYRNIQAPIGAIVRIQQRPENTIRPLGAIEAFATMLPACSSMKWDARIYRGVCDTISKLISLSRIWELGCLPNSEAAILCHDTVSKETC